MGVRKKGRRKIRCSDKAFVWFVELDYDSLDYHLHIIAEDKTLILICPLNMKCPYVVSIGSVFQNQAMNGIWHRYLIPFNVPEIITPKFVASMDTVGDAG